jgi:5'-AMP-activated protein kinase, catalytic alpha subunit
MHEEGVVHRDLKPENIMLQVGDVLKVADFGLCNKIDDGKCFMTSCGSPNYAAPEVIEGHPYDGSSADVWSCGVILYAMLCGTLPFESESMSNLFAQIRAAEYSLPSHLSELSRDIIKSML